jgi:hypothetical protein
VQCKKSNHKEALKESFENINSFEEILRYALEILTRNNWKVKQKSKCKGTRLTPKLNMDKGFTPQKLLQTPISSRTHSHTMLVAYRRAKRLKCL